MASPKARVAAISATKRCAELIPLCHPVQLTSVSVTFEVTETPPSVRVTTEVRAIDRTGPEMEAMTAAAVAALTVYDMCKAVDRAMRVENLRLVHKSGGKSGTFEAA